MRLVARSGDATAPLSDGSGVVVLDVAVTAELEAEGTARDVIRVIQQARRDAGLHVSDRISLAISADPTVRSRVEVHADLVATETLATSVIWDEAVVPSVAVEGGSVGIRVASVGGDPSVS